MNNKKSQRIGRVIIHMNVLTKMLKLPEGMHLITMYQGMGSKEPMMILEVAHANLPETDTHGREPEVLFNFDNDYNIIDWFWEKVKFFKTISHISPKGEETDLHTVDWGI